MPVVEQCRSAVTCGKPMFQTLCCYRMGCKQSQGCSSVQVDKDLRQMLVSPDAPAPKKIGVRVWPQAIPQFNVGHQDTVQVPPPSPRRIASLIGDTTVGLSSGIEGT